MNTFESAGDVAAKAVDRWAWYFAALENPKEIGKSLPIHENDPKQGYFRTRHKDRPWEPVAIFYPEDSDELVAYRNGRECPYTDKYGIKHGDINSLWVSCCRNPISYEAYQRAVDGEGWADDDPTVAAQIATPAPGHNSGDVSESELLRDQIEAAKIGAEAYAKITDDATAAKAQSLRARLNELARDADKRREELKRPHFEAGKAIDKEWQPLVKTAKEVAGGIGMAMSAWETEKLHRQRVAERVLEKARLAAEEAARKAVEAGEPVPTPEPVAAPVPAAPAPVKGSYGRAATVKAKLVVTAITNDQVLFEYFRGEPDLGELLWKLAQRAVDAGRTVPGVTVEEQAKVS